MIEHLIEQTEGVRGLDDIVEQGVASDSAGLVQVAGLVLGEPTPLDAVRVVGELHLIQVVEATGQVHGALLAQRGREPAGGDRELL